MIVPHSSIFRSCTRKVVLALLCQDDSTCPELLYNVLRLHCSAFGGVINAPIHLTRYQPEDLDTVLQKVSKTRALAHANPVSRDRPAKECRPIRTGPPLRGVR